MDTQEIDLSGKFSRSQLQWKRKIFHLFNGSLGLYLYVFSGLTEKTVLMILFGCLVFFFLFDIARLKIRALNQYFFDHFSFLVRKEEAYKISSVTLGLVAAFFMILIFPPVVNVVTMGVMTYADPAGAIAGNYFGKRRLLGKKTLEGSLAVFVVSAFFTVLGLSHYSLLADLLENHYTFMVVWFFFKCGLIGAFSELLFPKLDDNWIIPVIAAPAYYYWFFFYSLI